MNFPDYVDCRLCPDLHKLRTQIVWGHGYEQADIMFIAEGPGEREDIEGVPFRGQAGALLDDFMQEAGIDREETYISNTVLCRPTRPGSQNKLVNRPPTAVEISNCLPRLLKEIAAIDPIIIVALGDVAASALYGKKLGLKKSRGTVFDIQIRTDNDIVLTYAMIPTFHPAYLLRTRSQDEMYLSLKDMELAKDVVNRYKMNLPTTQV
jgi:DNA polymerase